MAKPVLESRTIVGNLIVILSAFAVWAALDFDREIGAVLILPTLLAAWNTLMRVKTTEPVAWPPTKSDAPPDP